MNRFCFDCGTRDPVASVGIFALRIGISLLMLCGHGIPKLMEFSDLRSSFPVPQVFPLRLMDSQTSLIATIVAEVIAPILIILGLLTRPAAFLLGFTMVVAAFHIHHGAPWFPQPSGGAAKEPALLFLIPMIALILSGAGAWSIDASLYRESRRRRW